MYFPAESSAVEVNSETHNKLDDELPKNQHQHQQMGFDMSAFIGRDDKQDVQETDNEALSSLLMLSKSNADPNEKQNDGEDEDDEDVLEYQSTRHSNSYANRPGLSGLQLKRNSSPNIERSMRGENSQPLSKTVRIEDLRRYFHLPIVEVARQLGTCTTALKKICRKNKINKWPYRQIRSITKSIQSLEMASLNDTLNEELKMQYREQIVTLQNAIDDLIRDPNKIVTLVNMGLNEDLTKNAERALALQTNAIAMGGGAMVGTGVGMMNLMPWPKPSADVQQIMQAAAALNAQNAEGGVSNAQGKPSRYLKRKLNGMNTFPDDNSVTTGGQGAPSQRHFQLDSSNPAMRFNNSNSNSGINAVEGVDIIMLRQSGGGGNTGGGSVGDSEIEAQNILNDEEDDDDDEEEGDNAQNSNNMTDNLRSKTVDIGLTVVQCDLNADSQKLQFTGPVQLAPLQRKKLKPNVTRKVVPLMEPDIGSNFNIEFVPHFVINLLNKSLSAVLNKTSLADLDPTLFASDLDVLVPAGQQELEVLQNSNKSSANDGQQLGQEVSLPTSQDVNSNSSVNENSTVSLFSVAMDDVPPLVSDSMMVRAIAATTGEGGGVVSGEGESTLHASTASLPSIVHGDK